MLGVLTCISFVEAANSTLCTPSGNWEPKTTESFGSTVTIDRPAVCLMSESFKQNVILKVIATYRCAASVIGLYSWGSGWFYDTSGLRSSGLSVQLDFPLFSD
ncbi:hypothetical protein SNE40_007596 [Patella caerulea]|uniref:Uncharacterized protein n=1 Tax=Patella caerulea TaxID=87958 RepID=A0AAN8JU25_PATCE